MLLVWNARKTRAYLARCGISTSHWKTGLEEIFNYSSQRPNIAPSTPGEVFIVDVNVLAEKVFVSSQAVEKVHGAARLLGLTTPEYECAGNESRLVVLLHSVDVRLILTRSILEIWCTLAGENAIDEQKAHWDHLPATATVAAAAAVASNAGDDEEEEEEEEDPNFIEPGESAAPAAQAGGGGFEDDVSDYSEAEY